MSDGVKIECIREGCDGKQIVVELCAVCAPEWAAYSVGHAVTAREWAKANPKAPALAAAASGSFDEIQGEMRQCARHLGDARAHAESIYERLKAERAAHEATKREFENIRGQWIDAGKVYDAVAVERDQLRRDLESTRDHYAHLQRHHTAVLTRLGLPSLEAVEKEMARLRTADQRDLALEELAKEVERLKGELSALGKKRDEEVSSLLAERRTVFTLKPPEVPTELREIEWKLDPRNPATVLFGLSSNGWLVGAEAKSKEGAEAFLTAAQHLAAAAHALGKREAAPVDDGTRWLVWDTRDKCPLVPLSLGSYTKATADELAASYCRSGGNGGRFEARPVAPKPKRYRVSHHVHGKTTTFDCLTKEAAEAEAKKWRDAVVVEEVES